MLFVSQEEQRASDTVLFTSENNDIANQSFDTSFFTSEKIRMTNQLVSLARKDFLFSMLFWLVNLGLYIIIIAL